jgi:proton-dependent oligopeptide transporter, POT family
LNIVIALGVVLTLVTGIPVVLQIARGHPRGLFILFFAEMWERFSFYGMRGLLIFFLTQHFLFDDTAAATTTGSYLTLVYALPLVGGVIADRWLGARKAVALGALLLVAGHSAMAIEGPPARQVLTWHGATYGFETHGQGEAREAKILVAGHGYDFDVDASGAFEIKGLPAGAPLPAALPKGSFAFSVAGRDQRFVHVLYLAMALIIMGVGFMKSNISAIVGKLYVERDPRRDSGFTLYYFGINLGAFWAAILCGYLGENFGWSWGFGAAGVGMAAGWLVFQLGRSWLEGQGEPPDPVKLTKPVAGPLNLEWLTYLGAAAGVAFIWLLVQHGRIVGFSLLAGWVLGLGYIIWLMVTQLDKVQRERIFLAFLLLVGCIVFFSLAEQAATSLNLFAERNTRLALIDAPHVVSLLGQRVFFGDNAMWQAAGAPAGTLWIDMSFDAAQTQAFNSAFILILAPTMAAMWTFLGRRRLDPDPMVKFGLGLAQVGVGFLMIVWCAGLADASWRLPLLVLAGSYLLQTTGEMCLSPVGLSEITKLAPATLASTLMSMWFLATSSGEFVAAQVARLAGSNTVGGKVLDQHAALTSSLSVFNAIGWVGVGFGALFLLGSPLARLWGHGVNDPLPEPAE